MVEKNEFTILYVDDEQHNLTSFKATFRREYKVLTAISAGEAMGIMRGAPVHLIITDQRMPGMTGVQFLEKIMPEYPDPVRIILTGFSDVEAIISAINTGRVFRYITKPWDANELRMTIENARQIYNLQTSNKELVGQLKTRVEEQERTLKLFIRYVPRTIVEKALKDTGDTIFEGEQRDIAALFCDIRGFTPLSERLSPKEVVAFLNDYYSLMTSIVNRHNGSVNQFVGDEVFAVFGVPEHYDNNELNAVYCAIEMIESLGRLNSEYSEKLGQEIKMGIGINFGPVVAGNLGSEEKMEYSVTGDTVNTGKRIETITKDMPNKILVSSNVYEATKDLIEYKKWEPVQVKGKSAMLQVYEATGRKNI